MAIDVELKTNKQNNTTWPSTFKASNRFPIVANRVFATLENAQQYVDDTAADASAHVGIVLAVVQDTDKNNGVYYVSSVAMTEGEKGTLVKVGGTETETAEDYAKAVELSKTLVVGQLIKVENEYKDGDTTYQKGFYIVDGAGLISALATSTGAEDEVGALKTRIDGLELIIGDDESGLIKDFNDLKSTVDNIEVPVIDVKVNDSSVLENGIANIDLTSYETIANVDDVRERVTELETSIKTKVEIVDGSRLMLETEGTKLEGIAEGAQVNVIEKIKVNGNEIVVADSDKSVDITIPKAPIQGVTSKEGQILTISEDGKLDTTLKIVYVKATETEKAVLRLQGVNDEVISSIEATDFIKDGMVSSVKLVGPEEGETGNKYLVITWNTDSGKEDMRIDVSELFNPYTASDGVALSNGNFTLKLDDNEQYLTVGTNGLSTNENLWNKVNELDNTVLSSAITSATTLANTAEQNAKNHADGLNSAMNERVIALEIDTHTHDNKSILDGITDEKVNAWDKAEQNAKDYADGKFVTLDGFNEFESSYEEKLNDIEAGAQVNIIEKVTVNGIDATIEDDKTAKVTVNTDNIKLGTNITSDDEDVYTTTNTLSEVLQGIQDSITVAVSGGLTSVTPGGGITVSAVAANKQTVSIKVSQDADNLIKISETDNGIFASMYYSGDDAE